MKNPAVYVTYPGRLEVLRVALRCWLLDLRRAWYRRFPPQREVVDHAHRVLRWEGGEVVTAFMEKLSCGHLLALERKVHRRRRCWKCARQFPKDSGLRVQPSHRGVLGPERIRA